VDFADTFDLWTARRSKSRFTNYEEKKWDVIKVNLKQP
jgi:hypothetical protein